VVLYSRFADGVNVATDPVGLYATAPGTDVPPSVNVNVVVFMVDAVMAWLKVAVRAVLVPTLAVPVAGVTAVTVGGTGAAAVVNVHV